MKQKNLKKNNKKKKEEKKHQHNNQTKLNQIRIKNKKGYGSVKAVIKKILRKD